MFTTGELTFGILLCRDFTYYEPDSILAARGAAALGLYGEADVLRLHGC